MTKIRAADGSSVPVIAPRCEMQTQTGHHWLWYSTALLVGIISAFAADRAELPPLTTASGNPRLPGKFVWADLVTDNVPAARTFYGRLFGWKFWDAGSYSVGLNDGRPLCGMFQRPR